MEDEIRMLLVSLFKTTKVQEVANLKHPCRVSSPPTHIQMMYNS